MTLSANYNYPVSYRIGCGRISELAGICKELKSERPLVVTDPGIARLPWFADIIAALEADGDDDDIDRRLQRNLDLWQADTTEEPCKLFETTLVAIADDPHEAYVGTLIHSRVPVPKGDNGECLVVEEKRKALAEEFAKKFPEAAKSKSVPKDFEGKKKTKKRRKRFRLFD